MVGLPGSIASVVDSCLAGMSMPSGGSVYRLRRIWSQVVGEGLAKHSEPHRLIAGVLTVRVDSSSWLAQLSFFKPILLERLQKEFPEGGVDEVRLRIGVLARHPPRPAKTSLPAPTAAEEQQAQTLVATVADPELRDLLLRLIIKRLCLDRHP